MFSTYSQIMKYSVCGTLFFILMMLVNPQIQMSLYIYISSYIQVWDILETTNKSDLGSVPWEPRKYMSSKINGSTV